MKSKKLKLGIIGGGPNYWIGHVHRISSRFDDKYEIVAGVFSRNSKQSTKFGKSIGVSEDRCYSNYLTIFLRQNFQLFYQHQIQLVLHQPLYQINKNYYDLCFLIHLISEYPILGSNKNHHAI